MRALDSRDCILVNEASWKQLFASRINFRILKKKSIKKLNQEYFGKLSGLYIENSNLPD